MAASNASPAASHVYRKRHSQLRSFPISVTANIASVAIISHAACRGRKLGATRPTRSSPHPLSRAATGRSSGSRLGRRRSATWAVTDERANEKSKNARRPSVKGAYARCSPPPATSTKPPARKRRIRSRRSVPIRPPIAWVRCRRLDTRFTSRSPRCDGDTSPVASTRLSGPPSAASPTPSTCPRSARASPSSPLGSSPGR